MVKEKLSKIAKTSFSVVFVASFHNTEVIFEQLSIIWALPRYRVNSLAVILPYFPTGTMERVDSEGQVATANVRKAVNVNVCKYFCRLSPNSSLLRRRLRVDLCSM